MTQFALDSSVVITWILQEQHWQKVQALIGAPAAEPLLLGPTLTEVIRTARRKGNVSSPADLTMTLEAQGCAVVHPQDEDLLRAAELLEAADNNPGPVSRWTQRPASLSLADALILAMAERRSLPVITRDQHWTWFRNLGLTSANVVPL